MNSIFIAVVSDWNMKDVRSGLPAWTVWIEIAFVLGFSLELLVRLMAHRMYFWVNEDMKWNIFDFFLVGISILEVVLSTQAEGSESGNMGFIRVFRLFKFFKVFRALRLL